MLRRVPHTAAQAAVCPPPRRRGVVTKWTFSGTGSYGAVVHTRWSMCHFRQLRLPKACIVGVCGGSGPSVGPEQLEAGSPASNTRRFRPTLGRKPTLVALQRAE